MRIWPVIDLLGGQVVRAIGGERSRYRPIVSRIADSSLPGDIARAFAERLGLREIYVADLDGILRDKPDLVAWKAIAEHATALWIDAGIRDATQIATFAKLAADISPNMHPIIGLESLSDPHLLDDIVERFHGEVLFSLDLQSGKPLTVIPAWQSWSVFDIAREVVQHGITKLLLLDLSDVGNNLGPSTCDTLAKLHELHPTLELVAGGGVRDERDLQALQQAGCSIALVGSALHNGAILSH